MASEREDVDYFFIQNATLTHVLFSSNFLTLQSYSNTPTGGRTMDLTARDIMVQDYGTIRPDAPVREAVRLIYKGKVRKTGYKPFGILVTDEIGLLIGMVSMFDVIYHLRPPFMNYDVDSFTVWKGDMEPFLDKFDDLTVEQVMSTSVLTASPEDHLMIAIDRMVKKRARRLPVVENDKILGIVYLSDIFCYLCGEWLEIESK